jgi:hypothetical protein
MKQEILIPTSLDDITIGDFQEFASLENPEPEDYFRIFLKIDDISKIKHNSIIEVVTELESLLTGFGTSPLIERFEFEGKQFGFIPKLDDITYGENKDATKYINNLQTMHQAMAVLYRPVTGYVNGKYLIEDYKGTDKYGERFKQLPLSVGAGARVFFYNLINDLLNCIPNYLAEEAHRVGSIKSGESTQTFTHSQKKILEELKLWLN